MRVYRKIREGPGSSPDGFMILVGQEIAPVGEQRNIKGSELRPMADRPDRGRLPPKTREW